MSEEREAHLFSIRPYSWVFLGRWCMNTFLGAFFPIYRIFSAIPGLTVAKVRTTENLSDAPAFVPSGPACPMRKRRPVRHNITMHAMMRYK